MQKPRSTLKSDGLLWAAIITGLIWAAVMCMNCRDRVEQMVPDTVFVEVILSECETVGEFETPKADQTLFTVICED